MRLTGMSVDANVKLSAGIIINMTPSSICVGDKAKRSNYGGDDSG